MSPETPKLIQGEDREVRLDEALGAYYAAVEAGECPDRSAFVALYPDVADELRGLLAEEVRLAADARPFRALVASMNPETSHRPDEADARESQDPRIIGEYEVLETIAVGGMGVVFRARHMRLGRFVALKMIRAGQLARREDLARFANEAEAAAQLDHPHIVPIYEVGECEGRPYFTMPLLEAGSLAERIGRQSLDPTWAMTLMVLVARAVQYAHDRGILHRDLKPSNILLDDSGRPHVADFGLAKRMVGGPDLTSTDAVLGTPTYMAPEQAFAGRGGVTVASDVYSLGAILYALLTGRPPHAGESIARVLASLAQEDPEPPSRWNRAIDRDLEAIVLKCVERDPANRYASAGALADDLERRLRGEPIQARRTSRPARLWRWCRRKPALAALSAVALASTTTAVAILAVSYVRIAARESELRAEKQRVEYSSGLMIQRLIDVIAKLRDPRFEDTPPHRALKAELAAQITETIRRYLRDYLNDPEPRPDVITALLALGTLQAELGESAQAGTTYEEAVRMARRRVAKRPRDSMTAYQLAHTLAYRGAWLWNQRRFAEASERLRESLAHYRRAVAIDPRDVFAGQMLAQFLLTCPDGTLVDLPAAERQARATLEWHPGSWSAELTLAQILYVRGRTRDCLAILDVLPRANETPDTLALRAVALNRSGDRRGALEAIANARRRIIARPLGREVFPDPIVREAEALFGPLTGHLGTSG